MNRAVAGVAGTVAVLHSNLLHASGHNLSAPDRRWADLRYNQVANHPQALIALVLVMLLPALALWLPEQMLSFRHQ